MALRARRTEPFPCIDTMLAALLLRPAPIWSDNRRDPKQSRQRRAYEQRPAHVHHAGHRALTPVRQRVNRAQLGDLPEDRVGQAQR
ncbi:hypothetical protein LJR034_002092 [Caballeronia sp. LjRoot34]|uniref:hypothetical protein n=1 Tax=Caballeronia sp. LjRoot34 TaxID=3342325 RepID=UPI003ECC28F5